MIYDVKENLKLYKGISRNLDEAIQYLMYADFSSLDAGRYPLSGDDMFAMLQKPETKKRQNVQWESHRDFIDIQFLISGSEEIGFQKIENMDVSREYDSEKDITFYQENDQGFFVKLIPDSFVVCFPTDAHMPLVYTEKPQTIKKVVVKVQAKDKGEIRYAKRP